MKKIEAIFRHTKLAAVTDAMVQQGIDGMTVSEVHGHGAEKGRHFTYRGVDSDEGYVPRIKLETVVDDARVEQAVETIFQVAHTGEPGDGRIFVTNIEATVRIRTGECDGLAIERAEAGAVWMGEFGARHAAGAMPVHF